MCGAQQSSRAAIGLYAFSVRSLACGKRSSAHIQEDLETRQLPAGWYAGSDCRARSLVQREVTGCMHGLPSTRESCPFITARSPRSGEPVIKTIDEERAT